jgi:YVTN family beta-propeller protein
MTLRITQLWLKLLLAVLFLLSTCLALHAALIYVVNSESRTLSRIDTDTDQVQNTFASLGVIPNKVIVDGDWLWSVNSGDNALQKIDRLTGATLANLLVESGCNPWDAVADEAHIYVTGLFTNKVYKVDKSTHAVVGNVNVGIAPEALCIYAGKLYVTNTGGYQNNYAGSSVSVIDLATFAVTATIPVSANPQYIIEHDGLLHVSCTGNWTSVFGAVCVINPALDELIQTIPIGGSPGGIWIDGSEQGLVGDGGGQYLYRYNALDFSVMNDSSNPLPNGGFVVWGNDQFTAALDPNWGGSGKVRILRPDLTFWKEYTVGMAPTDMKLWSAPVSVSDDYQTPILTARVYPNPAMLNDIITFETEKAENGTVKLYNLKGQLVVAAPLRSGKAILSTSERSALPSAGCYFYRINSGKAATTGKLLLL